MLNRHFSHVSRLFSVLIFLFCLGCSAYAQKNVLDKQALLNNQNFWDNKDWDWYKNNIPFFDSPDVSLNTTYYYRWEVVTKHIVYGSPKTGYTFTEFIDRPWWSGTYGAISCPAGHQLYEVRWLKDENIAQDYSRYWFRTEGAQPRRYSCWIGDSVWAVYQVHNDKAFAVDLLNDLIGNYMGWQRDHYVKDVGMFWQHGMADGMETNINSRQTDNWFSGAEGYRPTLNCYLYADAQAISNIADLAGKKDIAKEYSNKAAEIKTNLQKKLWDPNRHFFFHMFRRDETKKDVKEVIKALTLTYQSGPYAGNPHGREEIGFIPWQFNMPDKGYETAWQFLMDPNYFYAKFGPTVTERNDPLFSISKNCCVWSGQSWPYATTQTLKAMANLLNNYSQDIVDKDDYYKLLTIYSNTHRKDGKPYIAEAAHPDTGSWDGHDAYNHSEHYFHSGFVDLVISGLVGLHPRPDNILEINPLVPDDWEYFALDDISYHGHRISIIWDKNGTKYNLGKGFKILAGGKEIASSPAIKKIEVELPQAAPAKKDARLLNYAVNNDGKAFPRPIASHTDESTFPHKALDGNYWYHIAPPNRWTCYGSGNKTDWFGVNFGIERPVSRVQLYILEDDDRIKAPAEIKLEYWDGKSWKEVPGQKRNFQKPEGHRANTIDFPEIKTPKIRAVFTHRAGFYTGLTEFETWGKGTLPLQEASVPTNNIAYNKTGKDFPKASASYTSGFDKALEINDGVSNFRPEPRNRWTAFESPNPSDWIQIDFGKEQKVGCLMLHIYDDGGGVQAPKDYKVQYWDSKDWADAEVVKRSPSKPLGSAVNTVVIRQVNTSKVRIVFTHRGSKNFSGLTELEIWEDVQPED